MSWLASRRREPGLVDHCADRARWWSGRTPGGRSRERAVRVTPRVQWKCTWAAARDLRAGRDRRDRRARAGGSGTQAVEKRCPKLRTETMTVNMGPQHPSIARRCGWSSRSTEKRSGRQRRSIGFRTPASRRPRERKKWQQVIPLVERMDYLSAQSNSIAYCMSVEKLLGIEVPERVKNIRVLIAELQRINKPPRVARHARHGSRRRVSDALLLPRSARFCSTSERLAGFRLFRASSVSVGSREICREMPCLRSRRSSTGSSADGLASNLLRRTRSTSSARRTSASSRG